MGTVPISTRVAAVAKAQHGLVTLVQLGELGVSRRQIQGWTASGRLDRVLPGVARLTGTPASREQSFRAAVLWGGPDALVSHRAAGELWGFDGVTAARAEITVPMSVKKRSGAVIVHHTRGTVTVRRTRRGIPITTPERTLVDLAGALRASGLEIALESARRERRVTTASVARALEGAGTRGRTGTDALQQLLAILAAEPPCESALEVLTARVIRASGLPRPERQVEVAAGAGRYRLDFAWPESLVALECDGRKWHEIEGDFERDRIRWNAITATTGYRIVWATWRTVNEQPARLVTEVRALLRSGGRRAPATVTTARSPLTPAARTIGGHRDDVVIRRSNDSQRRPHPSLALDCAGPYTS